MSVPDRLGNCPVQVLHPRGKWRRERLKGFQGGVGRGGGKSLTRSRCGKGSSKDLEAEAELVQVLPSKGTMCVGLHLHGRAQVLCEAEPED